MVPPEELVIVDTPVGAGRLRRRDAEGTPRAVLLLGHGAGGQLDAFDLATLATSLPAQQVTVVLFEQPWKTAGRKMSAPPAQLDRAFGAAVDEVRRWAPGVPVVTGGRSQGARVACRTAGEVSASAVVCLAFPLHPPGHPEKSRLPELLTPAQPVLVCQGTRDSFGSAEIVGHEAGVAATNLAVVPITGADHSMRVRKSDPMTGTEVGELLVRTVGDFVASVS